MTVAIRFYNGFLTLNEPIPNLFITSNHKATEKQRLYRSTWETWARMRYGSVGREGKRSCRNVKYKMCVRNNETLECVLECQEAKEEMKRELVLESMEK